MTKIFNNRPLFYCFLAFGFGIYFAKPIFSLDIPNIVFVICAFATIVFLCIKFKHLYRLLLICLCFIIGVGAYLISYASFNGKDYGTQEYEICGRVCNATIYDSSQSVIIDNVYVDGNKIGENVSVFIFNQTEIEEGQIITFTATLTKQQLFTLGKFNSYAYKYNVVYSCSVDYATVDSTDHLNWSERLKLAVKGILLSNMGLDEASVSYASLFGDKTYIPSDVKESFSVTGIAHLLAVSGLHIGFVVAIFTFILNSFKIKGWAELSFLATILSLYCYICSFSASVVRASIMVFVLSISQLLGKPYDRLNSLSIAGIVCLLFRPLSVFDAGFLLSFACVFCIFMFARPMEEFFNRKCHLPKILSSVLGITVPVQLGLLPLLANYFTEVSVLSILANLICIPVFEIFFMLLFVFVPIVLIIPTSKVILSVPEFIIGSIIDFAGLIASIKWAIFKMTKASSLCIISIYAILFTSSHFVGAKVKPKIISCVCVLFVGLALTIPFSTKMPVKDGQISILNVYQNTVYSIELDGVSFAIGNFNKHTIKSVEAYAEVSRLYNYDYFISLNSSIPENKNLIFNNIYSCGNSNYQNYLQNGSVSEFSEVTVEVVTISGKNAGLMLTGKSLTVYICANATLNNGNYLEFAGTYNDIDVMLGKDKYVTPYLEYVNCNYFITDGENILDSLGQSLDKIKGNWTFNLTNSKLYNIRGVD